MRDKGRSRRDVLANLRKSLGEDAKYEGGRILSAMCTAPYPVAKRAHKMFLSSNLGDAGLFPGVRRLEKDVIRQLADLLNCKNGVGFLVSGGTEANLMALWAARNRKHLDNPEVIVPESAHFSFSKICNLLGLKLVRSKLDRAYRAIPEDIEQRITEQTIAIIGTAGTSELGVVDPITRLSEIAMVNNIHLHVDAAFGGLVIPFLEPKMQEELSFDFRLPGIMSLTVDPHKMGMSTIPAGGIIFRDKHILDFIGTETLYLSETMQYTFAGTRSGASAAATWAVFESLGREGFGKIIKRCMAVTRLVSKEIEATGLQLVTKPMLNIVAFRTANPKQTAVELRKKGWFISYVPRLHCLRIIAMPHFRKRHAQDFSKDLREIVRFAS